MKKIIRKFWGVGLIVILLSTLFVGAVPVANAATLAYSTAGSPNPFLSNQVAAASDASIVKIAPNGDIFVVDQQANPDRILKSVNGGHSWTAAAGLPAVAADNITDIAISPYYATDGYVYALTIFSTTNSTRVYQSTTGGASFLQLGGNIGVANVEQGTSIALDPTFHSGIGQIMVGTADVGGTTAGDVYIWGAPALTWAAQALAQDITAVAFSPAYPIDQTIFAVGSTGAGTVVNIKVFTNVWNSVLYYPASTIAGAAIVGFPAGIVTSSLAFPADFNASSPLTDTFYVGINAAVSNDVYRVNLVPTAASAGVPIVYGAAVNNVAYAGTSAAGTLYAGAVAAATYQSNAAPGSVALAAASWLPGGAVTGATNAYVAVDPAFATNATLYVGTTGAESALNVSTNAGVSFAQTGLIDTVLSAILDFVPFNSTEWYLVSQSAGVNDSLWKTTNGGLLWNRINLLAAPTFTAAVRLSPAFGTDKTMYFFETGVTPGAPLLRMSQDSGATWATRFFSPVLTARGVADVAVVDKFTMYAGDASGANVYKSTNNGFWWTAGALPAATGNVTQLKRDVASGHLLAGTTTGEVYRNALATPEAWASQGNIGAGTAVVAFDAGYSTNSIIYAGESAGVAVGVWRFNVSTPLAPWVQIDATIAAGAVRGILVTPDGVLYAASATPAALAAGGMVRILAPTTGVALAPPVGEAVTIGDGLTALDTLASLAYTAGSNILYSIENVGVDKIVTFTDTLTTAVPGVLAPGDGAIVGALAVVVTPITGAPVTATYQVLWDARADFAFGAIVAVAPVTNLAVIPALAGSTAYYRVRIATPLIGPWSQVYTAQVQLALVGPPGPLVVVGAAGTTGPGGWNVQLKPTFNWGNVVGASGYEFQLASDIGMTAFVVNLSGATALGPVQTYTVGAALKNSTTYYWRVRGISATSNTAWTNVMSFTTLDVPVAVAPPVIITQMPAPTINIPAAPQATQIVIPAQPPAKEISPTYIWAIIIIGAVLVIAVIVLIVRTRRAV